MWMLVIAVIACVVWLLVADPTVSISARVKADDALEVRISRKGRESAIWAVIFYDHDDLLWRIEAKRNFNVGRIQYGVVPYGMVQVFPEEGPPAAIREGDIFCVSVKYTFDSVFPPTPCTSHVHAWYEFRRNGMLPEVDRPKKD